MGDEGIKEGLQECRRFRGCLEAEVGPPGLGLDEETSTVRYRQGPIGQERLVDFAGFGVVAGNGCLRVEPSLRVEREAHEKQSRTRDCNRVAAVRHD
jgi:hypothetical protein